MGRQLEHQGGRRSPLPNPSCKPAGGWRAVDTRMEEPGGGWRSEAISTKTFGFQKGKAKSKSFVKIINLVGCVLGLLSVLETALRAKVLAN